MGGIDENGGTATQPCPRDCAWRLVSMMTVPELRADWALFLDIDGTLVEIAETPDAVVVPDRLASTLSMVGHWLGGALALVSGRPLDVIDALMVPQRFPCAGEYGAVMRLPDGAIRRAPPEWAVPATWRDRVSTLAQDWRGVIVENKPYSIVAHFASAPRRAREIRSLFESIVDETASDFAIVPARMAFEIRHRALTKAAAVNAFMRHAIFRDRVPVFIGDDVTDEDGFRAARAMGGIGLCVGTAFAGEPAQVRRWLERFRSSSAA
jgi:trehalose 6-phosphate phosphatase